MTISKECAEEVMKAMTAKSRDPNSMLENVLALCRQAGVTRADVAPEPAAEPVEEASPE